MYPTLYCKNKNVIALRNNNGGGFHLLSFFTPQTIHDYKINESSISDKLFISGIYNDYFV